MKEEILINLNNPEILEQLYRADKQHFRKTFKELYPELKDSTLAVFWHERLFFDSDENNGKSSRDIPIVIILSIIAGIIAKLPAILNIDEEFFYPRNIGFIIFPALTTYFVWRNRVSTLKTTVILGVTLAGLMFINSLPDNKNSDTLILSCIHMILVLWSLFAFAYTGGDVNNVEKRLGYLKYNGDLVVITSLIVIAGFILSGITIGLFSLIGYRIEEFYFKNIVVFALPAAPVIGTFLIQSNPQLVGRVSPVIARIFSPLVLIMLLIYLGAIVYSGKDPYNDREFLITFNALLIGVMALIFFSVAETTRSVKSRTETWILTLLSFVTIVVNGIALSAILFRISEGGITPNRAAVLGSNILILINLLLVAAQLSRVLFSKAQTAVVGKTISAFLPVYFVWAAIVAFIFPFIFGFK